MQDATALAAAIAEGRTTARAAMEAALGAAERLGDLGAVARIEPGRGRRDAEAADAVPPAERGPFHGVPFLGKDLGSYARGLAPAAGSPALRSRVTDPEVDSALFGRFRKAGLIPFGLTTVPEFGLALCSEPPDAAPARNPFDPARTPGGSSGGAAAAVAAGIVAIAHATDAAGSIRVPAACCGLYGLKPTRGATPLGPQFGNYLMGIASELVVARSLRDVRTAFETTAGDARGPTPDPVQRPTPARPRIAVAIPDRCGPEQGAAVRAAAEALAQVGCEVDGISAPDPLGAECHAVARLLLSTSLADWLGAMNVPDSEVSPVIAATAVEGRSLPGTALFAASREIARLSHRAAALFDRCDAILMPVLSGPPPRLGHFDPGDPDPSRRFSLMEAMAPNAAIANVAGLPALSFPFGEDAGLPLGLQLMGPMGGDASLIDIAGRLAPSVVYPHPVAGLPA